MPQPFFTIGVPTYNRHELLKQALSSILAQNFTDFEIIIGNDYTAEVLTGEMLGVNDPRIRIINHHSNLREVGNMNALLSAARGRYFTWLFDDDLYGSGYLQAAHATLHAAGFPQALYTSYSVIDDNGMTLGHRRTTGKSRIITGAELLDEYFSERLRLISTCGMFETRTLTETVGGVEELCSSAIGLYCEYLFLVRCGLFERVASLDTAYVVFRAHADSWGENNTELDIYREAGANLLRRCLDLAPRFSEYQMATILIGLSRIHLVTFATKSVLFETSRGQTGYDAKLRAIKRLHTEVGSIHRIIRSEARIRGFKSLLSLLQVRIHCYRFILGKFRLHRRDAR